MEQEEAVIDETVLGEEQIEPFDWEDYLYESWLEEKRERKRQRRWCSNSLTTSNNLL